MGLILEGERIYLRPLQKSDYQDFCLWYSDNEVTKFLGMKPLSKDEARSLFNRSLKDPNGVYFGVTIKAQGTIIGYVFLAEIMRSHRVAREFGIVIGDKTMWGQGYGSEATKLMLQYGFKHLKLHRIELIVLDFNKRAQHLYQKLGFVKEGIQREARLVDGKWHDVILMRMLRKDWK